MSARKRVLLIIWVALLVAATANARAIVTAISSLRFREHTLAAQALFDAALVHDTVRLATLADTAAITWAMDVVRIDSSVARAASHSLRLVRGSRFGDTIVIDYRTTRAWCPAPDEPSHIQIRLQHFGGGWRIVRAGGVPC